MTALSSNFSRKPTRLDRHQYLTPSNVLEGVAVRLDLVKAATVSPKNIDDLRQQLTGVCRARCRAGSALGWIAICRNCTGVVRGTDAQRAEIATLLNQARGDWRAGKRSQTVEETNQYAEDRAATANSGANIGNTYRQKLVALLNPKSREGRWYTPEEKADIRDVTHGETVANFMRSAGNLAKGIPWSDYRRRRRNGGAGNGRHDTVDWSISLPSWRRDEGHRQPDDRAPRRAPRRSDGDALAAVPRSCRQRASAAWRWPGQSA